MRDSATDAVGQTIRVGDKVAAIRKGGGTSVGRINSFTDVSARLDVGHYNGPQVYRTYYLVKMEDQS
ncbi:hypothetical protein VPHD148_0147 [Vibrio phage D148]